MKVSFRTKAAAAALVLGLAAVGIYLASGSPEPPDASVHAFKPVHHGEMPKFASPEAAKRYLDTVTAGDRRALALIDKRLKQARAEPNPDRSRIDELERSRAERTARLSYHTAARAKLGN